MRRVALVVVAALIAFPLTTAGAKPTRLKRHASSHTLVANDALFQAFENGRISGAKYSLERARSLFDLRGVRGDYGTVARPDPHSASLILADLAVRKYQLSGEDREAASDLLSRPTDNGSQPFGLDPYSVPEATPICTTNVCTHYVTTSADAPSSPTWAQDTSVIFQEVWDKEITTMGFRAPKSDMTSSNNGGNAKVDVYIQNIGAFGIYGYCTTDDPRTETRFSFADFSSFCVVDDDFSPTEFVSGAQGLDAMKVTAAHEFFHAVQFGYDATEDNWLKEATATWMEDEVYDTINDNKQYLRSSPLTRPHIPLDMFFDFSSTSPDATFQYGSWVFFRFLSESPGFGADAIRDIWTDLDSKARDFTLNYSLKAMQNVAADRGTSLRDLYATFAARALAPATFFQEGIENAYPSAPIARTFELNTAAPSTRINARTAAVATSHNVVLDHLTSSHIAFTPGADVAPDAQMTVAVDLPDGVRGSEATVVIMKTGQAPVVQPMSLDASGAGNQTVEFGRGIVERVVLVLTNGSSRFGSDCFNQTTSFSCIGGTPTDENLTFAYAAQLGTEVPPVTGGGGGGGGGDTTPPHITGVSDRPDPFRANGTRKMTINFTLDEDAFMKIQIFAPNGTRVLNFARTVPADRYFFQWNGVFRNRLVKAGKYVYKLSAVDGAGNRSAVKKGTNTVTR